MKQGDWVTLEMEGRTVPAQVLLASPNEVSLMVTFDAMLGGYVGMMPLLRDGDGVYRDLFEMREVRVTECRGTA